VSGWLRQVGCTDVQCGEENVENQKPDYRARDVALSNAPSRGKVSETGAVCVVDMIQKSISICRNVMLSEWGSNYDPSRTVQQNIVVGVGVV
jgi:hypothetical protein